MLSHLKKFLALIIQGHVCLHYKKGKGVLFSGDHLGGDQSDGLELWGNSAYNWYSGTWPSM